MNFINDRNNNLDDIHKQIKKISNFLLELDEIIFNIKNNFGDKIENLLNNIKNNLIFIDEQKYTSEQNLKDIIKNIGNQIEEIKNRCKIFEENNNNFYNKNKIIENEVNILNSNINIINEKNKKKENENKININNNYNNYNKNYNQNINKNNEMYQSVLYGIKDNVYKSVLLFENREEDLIENYTEEPTIIRKNWHEICYVYDDYDIHDIYYDIKAVGLSNNQYFETCFHGFFYDKKIEIESLLINGIKSNYNYQEHSIEFNIKLENLKIAKIHIKYKEYCDLSKLSVGEIEKRKIYRNEYYGLPKSLAGQMAKYTLILKGSFDIINFKDYFLIKNKNNLNENEYSWGGVVPFEGKMTEIIFSKNLAKWYFKILIKFHSNRILKNTALYTPIHFVGGNNEILDITVSSPQTKNIFIDGDKRQYIVQFNNLTEKHGELMIEGKLQNKCKGEWLIDLTDEDIDDMIPEEDKMCKEQLQEIAKQIIEDFDKNNNNKDFEFLDYMKIAIWIKNNIKYDLNYIDKDEYTAIDTYYMKVGVCHHFTKLCNALLYSLGYKVIYITGFVSMEKKEFDKDSGHAWSLIQINNKWYPFDSTWGILSGKLPVGHIFEYFFSKAYCLKNNNEIVIDTIDVNGKFIE